LLKQRRGQRKTGIFCSHLFSFVTQCNVSYMFFSVQFIDSVGVTQHISRRWIQSVSRLCFIAKL